MKTFYEFLLESSSKDRTNVEKLVKIINVFLPFVKNQLKLKSIPPIHVVHNVDRKFSIKNIPGIYLIHDLDFSKKKLTFGTTSKKNRIIVQIKDRHPIDILRTLAHELVHYHQHITGLYGTGETGSKTENQAHVQSGIIMRNFDQAHPEFFKLFPID